MSIRNDIAQRKTALLQDLRAAYHSGAQFEGEGGIALKQRELSERYGLSSRTISLALQELVEEGVLYTVPRIGTFMGRSPVEITKPYLFITPARLEHMSPLHQLQIGFEERIAGLGGSCLSLTHDEAIWHLDRGDLPAASGVFEAGITDASEVQKRTGVAGVAFGSSFKSEFPLDRVDFDNEEGGAAATRHLLSMGHRKIAFLAMHDEHSKNEYMWSVQREAGWRRVMQQSAMQHSGGDVSSLAFHPRVIDAWNNPQQHKLMHETVAQMLANKEITAVITANIIGANRLIEVLRRTQESMDRWPAIVCFDSAADSAMAIISYIRLPWEKIGAEAAQLLWERKTGRLTGLPQQRLLSMQLIPRLSCRSDWLTNSSFAQSRAITSNLVDRGVNNITSDAIL